MQGTKRLRRISTARLLTLRALTFFSLFLLSSLTVGPTAPAEAASDLVVRWHGDYYQHKWVGKKDQIEGVTYVSGTPKHLRANRWLRGANTGSEQYELLDADGDGNSDDSQVQFPFSMELPLNPRSDPARPNGLFYHADMPSARFYGGISATYLNYATNRIQQGYIENDGAGGALDDVGIFPSPYSPGGEKYSAELTAFTESVRHEDGRYKKSHIGPQEDFAINLYRPDLPHPLDPADDPSDNLVSFQAAFLWKKDDFLAEGDQRQVSLDSDSSFSFESTRWWENIGEARWIIQDGDEQFYISQFSVTGQQDNYGQSNEFLDPLNSQWALYSPTDFSVDFDQDAGDLVWLDPTVESLFEDIQAFGLYIENDTPSNELTKFSLDEIRFNAAVGEAFKSADFNLDGAVNDLDLALWQSSFGSADGGDADGDHDTDGSDFLRWQQQLSDSVSSSMGVSSSMDVGTLANPLAVQVPEPSSIILLMTLFLLASSFKTGR